MGKKQLYKHNKATKENKHRTNIRCDLQSYE
nr:MAG TPA: hypothetical protein [Caudoviricetes sp.]